MVLNGWPKEKSIYENAAYELLKWASENKDHYRGVIGKSIDKKSDLIYASRDNIPELAEFRQSHNYEKYKDDNKVEEFGSR